MKKSIKPVRKNIRVAGYDYSSAGYYFVTICTHRRKSYFGHVVNAEIKLNSVGRQVAQQWIAIMNHVDNIELGEFIVMPNHVHGVIVLPETDSGSMNRTPTIGEVVRSFKARCTRHIRLVKPDIEKLWQRNYYEHVIRDENSFRRISEYIQCNPLMWAKDEYYVTPG